MLCNFETKDSLLFTQGTLDRDDITILYFGLSEGHFGFHELNHVLFNFLSLSAALKGNFTKLPTSCSLKLVPAGQPNNFKI